MQSRDFYTRRDMVWISMSSVGFQDPLQVAPLRVCYVGFTVEGLGFRVGREALGVC